MATTKTKPSAREQLAALDEAVGQAEHRLHEAYAAAQKALAPLSDLAAREGTAWSTGDEAEAEKLKKERTRLQDEKASWTARINASDRAVTAAKNERTNFVREHGDGLLAAWAPDAERIRDDLIAAVEDVRQQLAEFLRVEQLLRSYTAPDRHRPEDRRLIELATVIEQLIDPEFQTPYSIRPLGLPDAMPLPPVEEIEEPV
jgi:hypothetical protein